MKRVFDEISDDEWENHSFKPSRVLKNPTSPPPPPPPPPAIESFAFRSKQLPDVVDNSSDGDDDNDDCFEIKKPDSIVNLVENDLEDNDVELMEVAPEVMMGNRGRRFVVDEDSDDEWAGLVDDDDDEEEDKVEEDDVVGKALQKCAKISVELRRELYGSSVAATAACDRYAEVEASSVRVVTQVVWS